ncbi:TIGR03086 family metal-binding protein [Haloechinothrix sp. LS1_15]|uniref:TIGR03086 family metal-binding protein n=1 Tax=Haloechinothrix sp. LS1_15 TaxID=2652248 RepID=UPI00294AB623|nr:TIGR03086 family metal-binding protein [Haloechinothrix sp. LS1_15]
MQKAYEFASDAIDGAAGTPLDAVTPCEKWDLRHVLNHLIGTTHAFWQVTTGRPVTVSEFLPENTAEADYLGADPGASFQAVAAPIVALYENSSAAERSLSAILFAPEPVATLTVQLCIIEWSVHGWDVTRSAGRNVRIPDSVAKVALLFAAQLGGGNPQALPSFGPPRETGTTATMGDQLVALLGRDPDFSRPGP